MLKLTYDTMRPTVCQLQAVKPCGVDCLAFSVLCVPVFVCKSFSIVVFI